MLAFMLFIIAATAFENGRYMAAFCGLVAMLICMRSLRIFLMASFAWRLFSGGRR